MTVASRSATHPGLDVVELEQVGVAILDHDRGAWQRGEVGEEVGELALDEATGEVGQGLALDGADDLAAEAHRVVPGGERVTADGGLLMGEAVGVALSGVHQDLKLAVATGPAGGKANPGAGLGGGASGLPEDALASALDAGKHELGATRARSSTRSMATPRRTQERIGTSSTISASSGQPSARWQ